MGLNGLSGHCHGSDEFQKTACTVYSFVLNGSAFSYCKFSQQAAALIVVSGIINLTDGALFLVVLVVEDFLERF